MQLLLGTTIRPAKMLLGLLQDARIPTKEELKFYLHGAAAVGGTVAAADAGAGTESGVPPKQKRAATAAATSSKWMGMVSNRSLANDLIEPAALGGWVVAIVGNRSKD